MAFINCSLYSDALGFTTNITVCLPLSIENGAPTYKIPDGGYKTLYLLHGLGDDHTIWSRKCAIDRFASTYNIAIVMPSGARSFYTDMAYGYKYYTYISEELPRLCESFFPLSTLSSKRFIGGLSMGGYGALKLGLSSLNQYAGIICLSGAIDIENLVKTHSEMQHEFHMIFGSNDVVTQAPHNIFELTQKTYSTTYHPPIYLACGTEDFLYEHSTSYKEYLEKLNYPFTYSKGPGKHDFHYWEKEIQNALQWIESL